MGAEGAEAVDTDRPVFEAPDDLLKEDDSVGDGFVPLHLQQHVMVVLKGGAFEQCPPGLPPQSR